MSERILILDGHPDPAAGRFVHGLAQAYGEGAREGKHEVMMIRAADLDFQLLRSQVDYEHGDPCDAVRHCQAALEWATHVVILYPLWLGSMPALLKGLLEQVLRPGFGFASKEPGHGQVKFQRGKSARIVVTMGMPGWLYRWYFRAHSLRSLQRNILHFVGFRRTRATLIGGIESIGDAQRRDYLATMRRLGSAGI